MSRWGNGCVPGAKWAACCSAWPTALATGDPWSLCPCTRSLSAKPLPRARIPAPENLRAASECSPPSPSLSLSLSRSLSRSLARCSACLPTTFTRSYTSLAFPRQNQTPPKHERSLVTIPFTTTEDGAQENNSSFFPARDLCLIVVLCTVVQSGEKFVNNNK